MKSFFKMVLATFVAIIAATLIIFLIGIGIVTAITTASESQTDIKPNSVFQLSLSGQIVERAQDNPFNTIIGTYTNQDLSMGLNDILTAIHKAKTDKNIKGIYIKAGALLAAPATLREIRQALIDFKQSGKFIYAYGNVYTQGSYYVASVADKIYLNPAGMLNWQGLSAQTTFYKGALDKLGVNVQVVRVGAFKSAVEPFIDTKMSDANRLQVTSFLGSIWQTLLQDVSSSRHIPVDQLNAFADQDLAFQPASQAVSDHLVDSLLYDDGIKSILRKKLDIGESDDIPIVKLSAMKNAPDDQTYAKDKIAIVYAAGEIDGGSTDGINSEELVKTLAKVRNDDNVKAVILRVNSPGGSALGSELIWREVSLIKAKKPIFVSMGDYAASGGYYISCDADTIMAQPNTITGSIGVFGLIPDVQGLTKKIGISFDDVKTNKMSDMPSITRPFTPEERDLMQAYVNNTYETFVDHVAQGRHTTPDAIKKIAQGRVWTGAQAKQNGLVDLLGNLNDAVNLIAKRAHLTKYNIAVYPKQKNFFDKLMEGLNSDVETRVQKAQLGEFYPYFKQLHEIVRMQGVQALMPMYIEIK
ncbi:signal peptide peptidase SppA [Microbacter margulisiae]|uniref:Protease-4 n=1 Tax=Microbacter margulisiae TaxID=1350067 RepID=A0A7W5DRZ9_9PORP|nr:signal peptide peptidase SppA [Microbacter margulisiae]MBB3187509.1 protease-4 [Microbacter margulisiae]